MRKVDYVYIAGAWAPAFLFVVIEFTPCPNIIASLQNNQH